MSEDPWSGVKPPDPSGTIHGKPFSMEHPWRLYWARGQDNKCLFVVRHDAESSPDSRLPRLRGVRVRLESVGEGAVRNLVFELEDDQQRDLFYRLCLDIADCAKVAESEKEAVARCLSRTWRWHHLLRGGGDRILSAEEQKGLIGELIVLEQHVLANIKCGDAIACWKGPLNSPKDFEIGHFCIEVKARRGAGTPHVTVTSEFQLDESGVGGLYLYVVDLDAAPGGAAGSVSLPEVAERVGSLVRAKDEGASIEYEALLAAAGFRWTDDYSDSRWLEGTHRAYEVADQFPRIRAADLSGGVSNVRYRVSLIDCGPYERDAAALDKRIRGESGGD